MNTGPGRKRVGLRPSGRGLPHGLPKLLVGAFVALSLVIFRGQWAYGVVDGISDWLDVKDIQSTPTGNAISGLTEASASGTAPLAAQYQLTTSDKAVNIQGQISIMDAQAACNVPGGANPCIEVRVFCTGAGCAVGGPFLGTMNSIGGGATKSITGSLDYTAALAAGNATIVVRVQMWDRTVGSGGAVLRTTEHFQINYVDPTTQIPRVCMTNVPGLNDLGRRMTRTTALTLSGRVEPGVTAPTTQIPYPDRFNAAWNSPGGSCFIATGTNNPPYVSNLQGINVLENGGFVVTQTPDLVGTSRTCDQDSTGDAPAFPPCPYQTYGVFSFPYTINASTTTTLRLQAQNSFSNLSNDNTYTDPLGEGINDDYTIVHDGANPDLGNGALSLLQGDYATRLNFNAATPQSYSSFFNNAVVFGTMTDAQPGRMAYVGYDLSSEITAGVNATTNQIVIRRADYDAMLNQAVPKTGDVIHFRTNVAEANSGLSYRITAIALTAYSAAFSVQPLALNGGRLKSVNQKEAITVTGAGPTYTVTVNGLAPCNGTGLSDLQTKINGGGCAGYNAVVSAALVGSVLELTSISPPTGFVVTVSSNLSRSTSLGGKFAIRHTAAAPLRVAVPAGGLIDFSGSPALFDAMYNRTTPPAIVAGDWVVFGSDDPTNSNQKFQITAVNAGARTIQISTTPTPAGAGLVAKAAGNSRFFVLRNTAGTIDGEDTASGYDCNLSGSPNCAAMSWAFDVKFINGANALAVAGMDDAGNSDALSPVVNFTSLSATILPPQVAVRQIFFYDTPANAAIDTSPDANPTVAACVNAANPGACANVPVATPITGRLLGAWTGAKVVGIVKLDPTGPGYPAGLNLTPDMFYSLNLGVSVQGSAIVMASAANSDLWCNVAAGPDPAGYCFVWVANLNVPAEGNADSGTNSAGSADKWNVAGCGGAAPQVTIYLRNLINEIALTAGRDVMVSSVFGTVRPVVVTAVYSGGNTVITLPSFTACPGSVLGATYTIPRLLSDAIRNVDVRAVQDNVTGTQPESTVGSGFFVDRTAPVISVTGFTDKEINVNFSPVVSITDDHLNLAAPVVVDSGAGFSYTTAASPGAPCPAGGTGLTRVTVTGKLLLNAPYNFKTTTDYVYFETNGSVADCGVTTGLCGLYGPLAVCSAVPSGADTLLWVKNTDAGGNAAPVLAAGTSTTNRTYQIVRDYTGIKLYKAGDVLSASMSTTVDLDVLVADAVTTDFLGKAFPLRAADPACRVAAPAPNCIGIPRIDVGVVDPADPDTPNVSKAVPLCDAAQYTPPNAFNPPRTNTAPYYPYRVMCRMKAASRAAYFGNVLGDAADERATYRLELYAQDTAVPPNVAARPSDPVDTHFSAVVTPEQIFINDLVLIFMNTYSATGVLNVAALDVCPKDNFGNAQSIFQCALQPVLSTLQDNPTALRGGQDVLRPFMDVFGWIVGSAGGTYANKTDGTAFSTMADTALRAFQELFPALFNGGQADSDVTVVLNLLKNALDRGLLDELPSLAVTQVVDPDNNPTSRDGLESLESLFEDLLQPDGGAVRTATYSNGVLTVNTQGKASGALMRIAPAILDALLSPDLRGALDVVNGLRIAPVERLNAAGVVVTEQQASFPLFYGTLGAVFNGFDPTLYYDGASKNFGVVYDSDNDGVREPASETRCYNSVGVLYAAAACGGDPNCTAVPLVVEPLSCLCGSDGGLMAGAPGGASDNCDSFGLAKASTVVDPDSDGRQISRAASLLGNDECTAIDPTLLTPVANGCPAGTTERAVCLRKINPGYPLTCTSYNNYADPNSALYEDPSIRNLRTVIRGILDANKSLGISTVTAPVTLGVSTLTSLLDIIVCVSEAVDAGGAPRDSAIQRFAPIAAALINQTGVRNLAECSGGGEFLASRFNGQDIVCGGSGFPSPALPGGMRFNGNTRAIQCPAGIPVLASKALAPAEFCTKGEIIFPVNNSVTLIAPALNVLSSPEVLEQINRMVTQLPDMDVLIRGLVAASDVGMLKRTLVTVAQLLDNDELGMRSGVIECGTPGAVAGSCRRPAVPVAEILLDSLDSLVSSVLAPQVRCGDGPTAKGAMGVACNADLGFSAAPGNCGGKGWSCNTGCSAHASCTVPGQIVYRNAEKLSVSVLADIVDGLWIDNPPAGCEFYQKRGNAAEYNSCIALRALDFDRLSSLWDFLDEFVNVSISQRERDSLVEALPTLMGGHQKASTGLRITPPNYERITPGPRPAVTAAGGSGDPDAFRTAPTASVADAEVWPPDRAFPSPLLRGNRAGAANDQDCGDKRSGAFDASFAGAFAPSGNAGTCWQPVTPEGFMPPSMPGRPHGRNPFDRYLCDDMTCYNAAGTTNLCGGATGTVGPAGTAATSNNTSCNSANKLTQKILNPYYGCWSEAAPGQPDNYWRWNLDVLYRPAVAIPETPPDCFDSPDVARALDEARRAGGGMFMYGRATILIFTIYVNANDLLNGIAGFTDPGFFPTSAIAYKTFGILGDVPVSEVLNLFATLRAARSLLANPLLGSAINTYNDCNGYTAAESGTYTFGVQGVAVQNCSASADPRTQCNVWNTAGDTQVGRRRLAGIIDRLSALEPLLRSDAIGTLKKMLKSLSLLPNQSVSPPTAGLYQTQARCRWNGNGDPPPAGTPAFDVYPPSHPKNAFPGTRQMTWGQGPVFFEILNSFENAGYAQTVIFNLLTGMEEGPQREILDAIFEVLGDWSTVTAELDSRIPPGSNFLRVFLNGVDSMVSPRDGTTVPCGNDGTPCDGPAGGPGACAGAGRDSKSFCKDGGLYADKDVAPVGSVTRDTTIDGIGPTDAEPFIYPLFPVVKILSGLRAAGLDGLTMRLCNSGDWGPCAGKTYGVITAPAAGTFTGVLGCAPDANGDCTTLGTPDYVFVKCQGGAVTTCDRAKPEGTLLPATSTGPSVNYSYLGHTFKVIHVPAGDKLVVDGAAFDTPTLTVHDSQARRVNVNIQTYARASVTRGMRSLGQAIVNDYNQDPDVPGVDVLDVDEVLADLLRCDVDGALIDTIMAYVDTDITNGDLRPLRNAIFALNGAPAILDAVVASAGLALGATGGAVIDYSNVCVCKDQGFQIVSSQGAVNCPTRGAFSGPGRCRGEAPITDLIPVLRKGALNDVAEEFALQDLVVRLLDPFYQNAVKRLSANPAGCASPSAVNPRGIPAPDCIAYFDVLTDAISHSVDTNSEARGSGGEVKLAEVNLAVPAAPPASGGQATAFQGRLKSILGGAGLAGLDTYTSSAPLSNGGCAGLTQDALQPDGVLDDCNDNGRPDFASRWDDGLADQHLKAASVAAQPALVVGNWFYNDVTDPVSSAARPVEIVSISAGHDGAPAQTGASPNDFVGRARVLAVPASTANGKPSVLIGGGAPLAAKQCFFSTTDNDACAAAQFGAGSTLRVNSFYYRARAGIQPVSIYPPVPVPPGGWVYVSVQQPSAATTAGQLGFALDTNRYTEFAGAVPGQGFFRGDGAGGNDYATPGFDLADAYAPNADFGSLDGASSACASCAIQKIAAINGGAAGVPIVRVDFTSPITITQTDVPFEAALPFLRSLFEKPAPTAASLLANPKRLRPAEAGVDALLALLLPLDIKTKNAGANATAIPASCKMVSYAGQTPTQNYVFLPSFEDSPLRRQRCDYFAGGSTADDWEMERGLGCTPLKPVCFSNPGTDPECYADPNTSVVPPVCGAGYCQIRCTETPRGMTPVDLDVSVDYVTPLELLIPLLRRLLLGTYADPIAGDGIDADVIGYDGFPLLQLLFGRVPALSNFESCVLDYRPYASFEACLAAGPPSDGQTIMTSLLDRLLVLPKVLSTVSDDPSQTLLRFFDNPADRSCPSATAGSKCNAITANLFNLLNAFSVPVQLRDRVTGIVDAQPTSILTRMLSHYVDAFFPPAAVAPTLPTKLLPPRLSLARDTTEAQIREGYTQSAGQNCLEVDPVTGAPIPDAAISPTAGLRPNCKVFLDLTVYHGQIPGISATGTPLGNYSTPFPGAVVSVSLPQDVEAGNANAIHLAAFHNRGQAGNSMLAYRIWKPTLAGDVYTAAAGDNLEYGILVPSTSHVKNVGLDMVFDPVDTDAACAGSGGLNSPFNPNTVRVFNSLKLSANATHACLRGAAMKFGNKQDQLGRPAEPSAELPAASDKYLFRRIPIRNSNSNEQDYTGKVISLAATSANSGIYLSFDTSFGAPRGRAEVYVSFIRITDPSLAAGAGGCLPFAAGDPNYCVKRRIYAGGAALPAGAAGSVSAANPMNFDRATAASGFHAGYQALGEAATCNGFPVAGPASCVGTAGPILANIRGTGLVCSASDTCPVAPACGSWSDISGSGGIGSRGCDSAYPGAAALRFRTFSDASCGTAAPNANCGRVRIPVKASMIPFLNRIQVQVRCGDIGSNGSCDEQDIAGSPAAASEILQAGDSAPVVYSIDTTYPPRPMDISFETLSGASRPVFQTTAVSDPNTKNTKVGEPAEDDAFFLDSRILDQKGRYFSGFYNLSAAFQASNLLVDYAVVRRPALEIRAKYNNAGLALTSSNSRNINVLGTGAESSTGPYTTQTGDYLEYEIYIPAVGMAPGNAVANAGIDIQSSNPPDGSFDLRSGTLMGAATAAAADQPIVRDNNKTAGTFNIHTGAAVDQNLRAADPRADLRTQGAPSAGSNFYYRRIPLPEGFTLTRESADVAWKEAGRGAPSRVTATVWAPGTNGLGTAGAFPNGSADPWSHVYFRQIRIGNSGAAKYPIYDEDTGRNLLHLAGSPCNDYVGGLRSALCTTTTPPAAACPAACGATCFALVFKEFTGLAVDAGNLGQRVVLTSGASQESSPCWGSHVHGGNPAADHDATTCTSAAPPKEVDLLRGSTANPSGTLRWVNMFRTAADAAAANPGAIEACDVSQDPLVIFKGAPVNGDWTGGVAIRINNERTSTPFGETQLDDNPAGAAVPTLTAGYDFTTLCTTSAFEAGTNIGTLAEDQKRCRPDSTEVTGTNNYGYAVGDGRFCPAGAGSTGSRCTAPLMSAISAGASTDYTAGTSHVLQRAVQVGAPTAPRQDPGSLFRFVYTMGVSSGRQSVQVRPSQAALASSEIQAYGWLLPPATFTQIGNPPPVPARIVFNLGSQADTNNTLGTPCDFTPGGLGCSSTSYADLDVQLQDQYGNAWEGPYPLKWEVTEPTNALRIKGRALKKGAFLGLKLNTGLTWRPRWEYPVTCRGGASCLASSLDADASRTANWYEGQPIVLCTDAPPAPGTPAATAVCAGENNDTDNVLALDVQYRPDGANPQGPSGLIPGDTVRIGPPGGAPGAWATTGDVFTATVRNVQRDSTERYEVIEFENIYSLSTECQFVAGAGALGWGIDTAGGLDANQVPGFVGTATTGTTGLCATAKNLRGHQIFVTNPHTAGDDFPCNEKAGPGTTQGNTNSVYGAPPVCEISPGDNNGNNGGTPTPDNANGRGSTATTGICQGGNYSRGADGAWRRVTQYKSDYDMDDLPLTELQRHCYELNFTPPAGPNPSGAPAAGIVPNGAAGQRLTGSDVSVGDVRLEYGTFGGGASNPYLAGSPNPESTPSAWPAAPYHRPGDCGGNPGGLAGAGGIAWNCQTGLMQYEVLVPEDGVTQRAHVGMDFAGLPLSPVTITPNVIKVATIITITGSMALPISSRVFDWFNTYHTGRTIAPFTSQICVGHHDGADGLSILGIEIIPPTPPSKGTLTDPITINGESAPYAIVTPAGRADIRSFDGMDPAFPRDAFKIRGVNMPRVALWSPEPTVNRLTCRNNFGSNDTTTGATQSNGACTATANQYDPDGAGSATVNYVRQGIWLAAVEGTSAQSKNGCAAGGSIGCKYDFFTRKAEFRSANDFSLLLSIDPISASILGIAVDIYLSQPSPIPFFFTDTFYAGSGVLPSTSLHAYGQYDAAQPALPANDLGAFDNVYAGVAGGVVKVCTEPNAKTVLPFALPGARSLSMAGMLGCFGTADGQSRPGSYAVSRVNDPFSRNGRMRARLFFPPWPNTRVALEVSAPGVPALKYGRNILRAAASGGGGGVGNSVPVTNPALVGISPCAGDPATVNFTLTGTDADCTVPPAPASPGCVSGAGFDQAGPLTVNVRQMKSGQGSLAPLSGPAPLTVTYTKPTLGCNTVGPGNSGIFVAEFTVTDSKLAISPVGLATISVKPQPTAGPTAPASPVPACEDLSGAPAACSGAPGSATVSITLNGSGGTAPLTSTVTDIPDNGSLDQTSVATGTSVLYTPNPNFCGTDTFRYIVVGSDFGTSDPLTVTVNVQCINDPPDAAVIEPAAGTFIIVNQPYTFEAACDDLHGGAPSENQSLTYSWNLAGGTLNSGSLTSPGPLSVTWATIGTKAVTFTCTDSGPGAAPNDNSTTVNFPVDVVNNTAPVATIDAPLDAPPGRLVLASTDTTPPLGITDNTPAPAQGTISSLTVSVPGTLDAVLTDVDVRVNVTADTTTQDIDIWLEHPDGTLVWLSTDNGAAANYTDTVFDTQAATCITAGAAPFTGSFRPENGEATAACDAVNTNGLNVLNGRLANGVWKLHVRDDAAGGSVAATLNSWSLEIQYNPRVHMAQAVSFDGRCTDLEGNTPFTHSWNFGVGATPATSNEETPSGTVTWAGTGTKTVTYSCTDGLGAASAPATLTVDVINRAPVARIDSPPDMPVGALSFPTAPALSLAIPDGVTAGTVSNLTVSAPWPGGATLADVNVLVNVAHANTGHIDMWLEHPDGTLAYLTSNNGAGANYTNTLFDSQAATCVVGQAAPFSLAGGYRSEGSANDGDCLGPNTLDIFYGKPALGVWKLHVADDTAGTLGTLTNWRLDLTPMSAQSFTASSPLSVPDNNAAGVVSNLAVAVSWPNGGILTDVNVRVDVSAGDDQDIDIWLEHPDGTLAYLTSDNGAANPNYTNTVFDIQASTCITTAGLAAPFTGTFLPENTAAGTTCAVSGAGTLAALNGKTPNGVWKLHVADDLAGEAVPTTLNNWRLDLQYRPYVSRAAGAAFAGTCADLDSNIPYTHAWNFLASGTGTVTPPCNGPPDPDPACSGEDPGVVLWDTDGTKTVTYSCQDSLGVSSNVATMEVEVINRPPVATIDAPPNLSKVSLASGVAFQATCADPDGNTPYTHSWNFLTSGTGTATPATAAVEDPPGNVVWSTTGFKGISYQCFDSLGTPSNVATMQVEVTNLAPVATIDTPPDLPPGAQSFTRTHSPALAIPNTNPGEAISDLTVTVPWPYDGVLTDVNVLVNVNHATDADLDIWLEHPSGTLAHLSSDIAGVNYVNTLFDDDLTPADATTCIVGKTAPFTGSFRPEGADNGADAACGGATDLDALSNGIRRVNGIWRLHVRDDAAGSAGTLLNWRLDIQYRPLVSLVAGQTFQATCTEPDGDSVTHAWNFLTSGTGTATPATAAVEDPPNVVWSTGGTKGISYVCTDQFGLASVPAVMEVEVTNLPTVAMITSHVSGDDVAHTPTAVNFTGSCVNGDGYAIQDWEWSITNGALPDPDVTTGAGPGVGSASAQFTPATGQAVTPRQVQLRCRANGIWGAYTTINVDVINNAPSCTINVPAGPFRARFNNPGGNIVDNATTNFALAVGAAGTATDANVRVNINLDDDGLLTAESEMQDMDIYVQSPVYPAGGNWLELSSDNGGTNDTAAGYQNTTFDQAAAACVVGQAAPFQNDTYDPEGGVFTNPGPATAGSGACAAPGMDGFNGTDVNGTWTLRVVDDNTNGSDSTLNDWWLDMVYNNAPGATPYMNDNSDAASTIDYPAPSCTDPDTGDTVPTIGWNFGANATPATFTGADPGAVNYSASGLKTVTLTGTDNFGLGGTDTADVQVLVYP